MSIQGKDDKIIEENTKVKTGDKFVIALSSSSYTIHLSAKGDITGRGVIDNKDTIKVYQILRERVEVENYYKLASDINEDGILKINEVAKSHQYVEKKIESLEE